MNVRAGIRTAAQHGMRTYYLAFAAGALLTISAFLPWVFVGDVALGGVPDVAGFWILALGLLAIVLASLSIYTRKNSRHPLLIIGLAALGIMFLAYHWMERSAREHAWASSQALAIVDEVEAPPAPHTAVGSGLYLGLAASAVLVLFGLTIVLKRVATPYAVSDDDEV